MNLFQIFHKASQAGSTDTTAIALFKSLSGRPFFVVPIPNQPDPETVTKAVILAFNRMPNTFQATDLIADVRSTTGTRDFDSTILRMLRRCRQQERIQNWKCIDNKTAQYQKIAPFDFSKN